MSDKMRYRYGDTNPVVAAVDSETVIERGDLVYQDVDDAKPASNLPDAIPREVSETEYEQAGPQEHFAQKFLGVALQRSRSGDTDTIRVATTGVFEFDCPGGIFELGSLVGVFAGPLKGDDGLPVAHLWNQQVVNVAESKYAIARVAKRAAVSVSSVFVDIRSKVMGIAI